MSDGIFTFFDKATVESMFKRVANGPLALIRTSYSQIFIVKNTD